MFFIRGRLDSPVTGASISIIVFSERSRAAPSFTIRRAAASSILPSRIKCCLRTSGRGRFVSGSNTSATVSLCDGGKRTSAETVTIYLINRSRNGLIDRACASVLRLPATRKHARLAMLIETNIPDLCTNGSTGMEDYSINKN